MSDDEFLDTLGDAERGIGDNQPPTMAQEALERLNEALAEYAQRRDEFVAAAGRVKILDRHDVGKAADLIGLAGDVGSMVEEKADAIRKPHREADAAVRGAANEFWRPVAEAMAAVRQAIADFRTAEKAKIAAIAAQQAEEDKRRREERGLAEPAPTFRSNRKVGPSPKAKSYRGAYGRQAIVNEEASIELEDWHKLPNFIFQAQPVIDAIIATVKPLVKKGVPIDGIRVGATSEIKVQVRR